MLSKDDFVKKVKEALNLSSMKVAKDTVDAVFNVLTEAVTAGEEVSIIGLGKFSVTERAARKCRNPQTGETIDVPAKKVVKFKLSSSLKNSMNA
jgi:nucleoid DNA-binding protein